MFNRETLLGYRIGMICKQRNGIYFKELACDSDKLCHSYV